MWKSAMSFGFAGFAWFSATAFASAQEVENFSLPTADGSAQITGEIDFPEGASVNVPVVILVPGTGLFDRDALFGSSGSPGDFIFQDLSHALNQSGVATIRMDYRGVHCNRRSSPEYVDVKKFYEACVDRRVREVVTPETIESDIALVFDFATSHPRLDAKRIAMFGHSEGSYHISRLIGASRIAPRAAHFMGMLAESPMSIIHWQIVERWVDLVMARDKDADGSVTNDEIARGGPFLGTIPASAMFSPTGSWSRQSLKQSREKSYNAIAADALSTPDDAPYTPSPDTCPNCVMASYRWWKMFFRESIQGVTGLFGFRGSIWVHNGDADTQAPSSREFSVIDAHMADFTTRPTIVFYPGKGHSLSSDPIFGPIDGAAKGCIVAGVIQSLAR